MGLFTRGRGQRNEASVGDAENGRAPEHDLMMWRNPLGEVVQVHKREFVQEILPQMLDSHWHDADTIYSLCRDGVNAGLYFALDEASERLIDIDRNPERATLIRCEILRTLERPDEAERAVSTFIRNYGETANSLTERARIYSMLGDDADAIETLWRSIELDANRSAALEWWLEMTAIAEPGVPRSVAMARVAELPTAWLPKIELAREALDKHDVATALARYKEVLERGAHDTGVLANVIGDLGTAGFRHELVDVVTPWYLPARHGTEIGLVLLETCVATGQTAEGDSLVVKLGGLGTTDTRDRVRALAKQLDDVKRGVRPPETERGDALRPKTEPEFAPIVADSPGLAPLRRHLRPVPATRANVDESQDEAASAKTQALRSTPLWFEALHRPDWLFADEPRHTTTVVIVPFSDLNQSADHGRRALGLAYALADRLLFTTNCNVEVVTALDDRHIPIIHEDLPDAAERIAELAAYAKPAYIVDGRMAGYEDTLEIVARVIQVASPDDAWTKPCRAIVAGSDAVFDATDAIVGRLAEVGVASPTVLGSAYSTPPPRLVDDYIDAYADLVDLLLAAERLHVGDISPALSRLLRLTRAHSSSVVPKGLFFAALEAAAQLRAPALHEIEPDVIALIKGETNPASALYSLSPLVFRLLHMDQLFNDRSDELTLGGDPRMWAWLSRL